MKLPGQYKRGDKVAIASVGDLEELLEIYGREDVTYADSAAIGGRMGTILWAPSSSEIDDWDGRVPIRFDTGRVYNLPFACVVEIPEGFSFVEEPKEEVQVIRDKASEGNLVMQMAAETIQTTYRSYYANI